MSKYVTKAANLKRSYSRTLFSGVGNRHTTPNECQPKQHQSKCPLTVDTVFRSGEQAHNTQRVSAKATPTQKPTYSREDVFSGGGPLAPLDEGSPAVAAAHQQQLEGCSTQLTCQAHPLHPARHVLGCYPRIDFRGIAQVLLSRCTL